MGTWRCILIMRVIRSVYPASTEVIDSVNDKILEVRNKWQAVSGYIIEKGMEAEGEYYNSWIRCKR